MSVIKKIERKNIILFIIIGILLLAVIGIKAYFDFFKEDSQTKVVDNIDNYGYTVSKNDTELFKTTFEELKTILNEETINYENYAKTLSKLFIIDLFTLDNKQSSQDIGSLEYIFPEYKENFKLNMSDTLYKYIEIKENRTQTLPTVTLVEITNTFNTTYEYNKVKYDSYIISLKWTYDQDLDYQTTMDVTLIKDNNKLYVVKGK